MQDLCKRFQKRMGDIELKELPHKIKRFDSILQQELEIKNRKRELKPAYGFSESFSWHSLKLSLQVLLTIPVIVSSAERSSSKLKLIKYYLWFTKRDETLSGLAIISTENECAHLTVVNTFAHAKSWKKTI